MTNVFFLFYNAVLKLDFCPELLSESDVSAYSFECFYFLLQVHVIALRGVCVFECTCVRVIMVS